jgi:hypothetical protein
MCGYCRIAALILTLLSGWYTGPGGPRPHPAPRPVQPEKEGVLIGAPDSLVHLSIYLSDSTISVSEQLFVTVSIINLADRRILCGRGSSTCRMGLEVVGERVDTAPF